MRRLAVKRKPPKPFARNQSFNKGSTQLNTKTTRNFSQIALKTSNAQNKPPPNPATPKRYYKCHDLRNITSKCPTNRVITLAEYQVP